MRYSTAATIGLIIATGLLLSPLASAAQYRPAGPTPDVPFNGVLTITSGCALSTVSAPVSQSGDTFTFTGNWTGSLIVLCSGATVNGAGHILSYEAHLGGNPGVAVTVNHTRGVTIENFAIGNVTTGVSANATTDLTVETMAIQDASSNGIDVFNSVGATIQGNLAQHGDDFLVYLDNVTGAMVSDNNGSSTTYGIEADFSTGIVVDDNNVSLNPTGYGVGFDYTNDSNASDNLAFHDEYALWADYSSNDSFVANAAGSNTYYGIYVDYDTDVTVMDNILTNSTEYGVGVEESSQVDLRNNVADRDYDGVYIDESNSVTATGNNASFDEYGFYMDYADQVTLSSNQVFGATTYAFYTEYTTNTLISDNHAPWSDEYGVYCEYDNGTTIIGNDFTNASDYGVYSDYASSNLMVLDNDLANTSDDGFYADEPYGTLTVSGNDVQGSLDTGIEAEDSYGGLTISDNDIGHAADYGVELEDTYAGVTVTDNNVTSAADYGVYLEDAYAGATISDNDVAHAADYGVYVDYSIGSTAITGNNVSKSGSEYGIYIYETEGSATVTGNNVADAADEAIYFEETYGTINVSDNVVTNSTADGIYADEPYGPTSITGNDLAHSQDYGIYADESYGPMNISGNDVSDSEYAIYLDEPYGPVVVTDNDATHSTDDGIYVEYAYEGGSVAIQGNNASGSKGDSLYDYESEDFLDPIVDNDLSNSAAVYIDDSSYLEIVGNDLLNVSSIEVEDSTLASFYHNDINTSAFDGDDTYMETGNEYSWNAPYPVGGNYWTGYTGKDVYSGPGQNVPGSDGIGDTPEPVPGGPTGAVDQYPLMKPWTTEPPTLEFTESGLPTAASWSVVVSYQGSGSGSATGWGTGSSPARILVPYGAATPYTYTVTSPSGWIASPPSGSGTTGIGTSVTPIMFSAFPWVVSFAATGISSGTSWSVSVNGNSYPSTTLWDNVTLGNGSYPWSASTMGAPSAGGTINVDGEDQSVPVAFHLPTYSIEFTETGLPSGAMWSVAFNGAAPTVSSSSVIGFSVPNGTYAYLIATSSGFTPSSTNGHVEITGASAAVPVTFSSPTSPSPAGYFAVVFVEAGLSSGASWSVTLNGSTQTSGGTTIVFSERNGTLPYSVSTTGAAAPQKSSGSVILSGSPTTVTVLFGSAIGVGTTGGGSSGPGWTDLYLVGALAAVFGILAALGFTQPYWRGGSGPGGAGRRRRPDETPQIPPAGSSGGPGAYYPPPGAPPPGGPGPAGGSYPPSPYAPPPPPS